MKTAPRTVRDAHPKGKRKRDGGWGGSVVILATFVNHAALGPEGCLEQGQFNGSQIGTTRRFLFVAPSFRLHFERNKIKLHVR